MMTITYPIIIHQTDPDETGYWVSVPDIPQASAQGDTLKEATRMIKRSIELALADKIDYPPPTKLTDIKTANGDILQLVTINL